MAWLSLMPGKDEQASSGRTEYSLVEIRARPLASCRPHCPKSCEALVGSVHFEGRICEELLRLSSDGFLRCFTPYDCEKPRISVHAGEILQIEALPGPTLGRFMLWQAAVITSYESRPERTF